MTTGHPLRTWIVTVLGSLVAVALLAAPFAVGAAFPEWRAWHPYDDAALVALSVFAGIGLAVALLVWRLGATRAQAAFGVVAVSVLAAAVAGGVSVTSRAPRPVYDGPVVYATPTSAP